MGKYQNINLPSDLQVEREGSVTEPHLSLPPRSKAFAPEPEPEKKPEKNLLEKAAEVVEEVVKPKRRGRPKKTDASV